MMTLTRQEKEKLVLDLYYNQNKSYHQIAKEARICPRDIKAILEKPVKAMELKESMSVSSQAYKLFSERKTLAQVAITLNLREPEVTKFHMEYCKLTQLDSLCRIYDQIKDDINPFVNLYILSKVARMDAQQVVRLLTIANNDLPSMEYRCEKLKREEASLKAGNQNSARTLQELSDHISDLRNTVDSYSLSCEQEKKQMAQLRQQKMKLEALLGLFQNNNEEYLKITKDVEEKVLGVLSNVKVLLRYALLSITESITNNPERYRLIFYNMSSLTDYYSSNSQPQQLQYLSQDNNNEANASMIIDEAEKLFNKVVKDCINKVIIIDYPLSKPSSLPLLPPSTEEQQKSYEIKSNSNS